MTTLPADTFWDSSKTEGEASAGWFYKTLDVWKEMPGGAEAIDELTISSGSITPTQAAHRIDTESDAASDDLANMVVTNHPEARRVLVRAENATRSVVLKHEAGGSGQLSLAFNLDVTLDDTKKWVEFILYGTTWYEIGRGGFEAEPGLKLLRTKTASSSATIDFDDGDIDSAYDEYEIRYYNVIPGTDDQAFYLRTSSDAGVSYDSGGTDYTWSSAGSVSVNDSSAGQISLSTTDGVGNATNEIGCSGRLSLVNPSTSTYTNIIGEGNWQNSAGSYRTALFNGVRASAGIVDAVRFLFASGNIASGTFRLYGVQK